MGPILGGSNLIQMDDNFEGACLMMVHCLGLVSSTDPWKKNIVGWKIHQFLFDKHCQNLVDFPASFVNRSVSKITGHSNILFVYCIPILIIGTVYRSCLSIKYMLAGGLKILCVFPRN